MKESAHPDREIYDAIIIGGGPGGSTVANLMARQGKRVLVLEKSTFPRFHIGESLLPYNRKIFEDLGVIDQLDSGDFVSKSGAQIGLWNGRKQVKFIFQNGCFTEFPTAWQVERSRFDTVLLDQAAARGAEVRQGCEVTGYAVRPERVSVTTRDGEVIEGRYLVDASGTGNLTGNREGIKRFHPKLRKIAVFTHFKNVEELPGREAGDIQIFRHPRGWFWVIPLGKKKSSVGVVFDKSLLAGSDRSPDELFQDFLEKSPALQSRLQGAERTMPLRTMVDFSYTNERLVSDRLMRVGDAAGFIDPIFSSGVYLAMLMGQDAAEALCRAGDEGNQSLSADMISYEKRARRNMKIYRDLIVGFYRPEFFELLLHPENRYRLPCALNAVFAGRLDEIPAVRWRIRAFQILTNLQKHFTLVPRVGLR